MGVPNFAIETFAEAPSDVIAQVDQGLSDYNAANAALGDVQPLSCIATCSKDAGVIGGAIGRTWGQCCELQEIWVEASRRRQGVGSEILLAFEQAARDRGCTTFLLETFSFQAPEFYLSHGYTVAAEINGFAPGVTKYLMTRRDDGLGE